MNTTPVHPTTEKAAEATATPSAKAAPKKTTKVKAKAKPAVKVSKVSKTKKAKAPSPAQAKKPASKTTPSKNAKAAKVKKPKLVRDSFTMPKDEYAAIATLKTRSVALERPVKKSELLRAGIKLLSGLSDKALLTALKSVPALKTGRPAKA